MQSRRKFSCGSNPISGRKYESYRIAMLVINCILLFSTISLNGISVITIRKSSQLRSKICYFVILLQCVVDLCVGVLGIPIFIYYLLFPFLDIANCTFFVLAFRNAHLTCLLSMTTLSAMTMERYIGVLHPYYYETKVTKKRILIYVCGSGLVLVSALACSFLDRKIITIGGRALIFVCLLLTGLAYTRIYLVIRKLIRSQKRPTSESHGNQNNIKKKIACSRKPECKILLSFCYLFCCFLATFRCDPSFLYRRYC